MKVVCVDCLSDGHHISYLEEISKIENIEFEFILPIELPELSERGINQHIVNYDVKQRSRKYDLKWIRRVKKVLEEVSPDIVHFLYGDIFYGTFGLGLFGLSKYKTVVTFHVVKNDKKHKWCMKFVSKIVDTCVVHTDKLKNQLNGWKLKNVQQIEYPCFFPLVDVDKRNVEARHRLGIPKDRIVFSALGATREYKGLDILLEALKNVEGNFHLLIAGNEEAYNRQFIEEHTVGYSDRVTLVLHYLSDDEFVDSIACSDYIVLPYRSGFAGASGPLAEGVMYRKKIISSNTGSIGDLVSKNDLGFVFEAGQTQDLADCIQKSMGSKVVFSSKYDEYRKKLAPANFRKQYKSLYLSLH